MTTLIKKILFNNKFEFLISYAIDFNSFDQMQNNLFVEKIILFKLSFILLLIAAVTTFSVMFIQNKQIVKQSIIETSFRYDIDLKVN